MRWDVLGNFHYIDKKYALINKNYLIMFSAQTPGLRKKTQVWTHLKFKIMYENFLQQKDFNIHNQRPFFVYKMKILKKRKIHLKQEEKGGWDIFKGQNR